ncbi:MAG: efflux RND transporter permease subunit [Candidatus Omnitrophota bacterium]
MNLPKLSIRRPVAISMVFFVFLLLGGIALFRLPVELQPNVEIGNISINLRVRGGISSQEIEDRIAKPLENVLAEIDGLEDIITISEEGECRIVLYFKPEINLDYVVVEVREQYAQVQDQLPEEVERPVIAKYEYSQVPVVILGVTSQIRSVEELRKVAEDRMKNRFSRIEGVAKVEVGGGREEKIFVEVDEIALRGQGLAIDDVVRTLNVNNLNLIAGDIKRGGSTTYLVRTVGQFSSLEDIKSLPINPEGSSHIVRMEDIAKIEVSYLDPMALARVNSQPSISLYVQKSSGANTIKVVKNVQEEIDKLAKELPEDINIRPYFNHAEYINQAISTVRKALCIGAILTLIVLWIFLRNFKYIMIVALTIPFSIITAFSLMYLSNISINVVTLSGIALGIGILVDSSIVVLENIFKKRESFLKNTTKVSPEFLKITAEQGAGEVLIAITASTLTTIAVFVPLFFVNKEIQRLYSGLALTVVFALCASLFFAFTLVPLLASRISTKTKDEAEEEQEETLTPQTVQPVSPGRELIKKIIAAVTIENLYQNSLDFVIKKRYFFIAATIILLIFGFARVSDLGREFIGAAEQNRFTVYVQMPSGTKIEVSNEVVKKVEAILSNIPEIKDHTSRIKGWSSQIYVELKAYEKTDRGMDEVIEEIRQKTEGMDPAFIYSQQPEAVGRKEIMIEIFGPNYDTIKDLAHKVGGRIKGIEGFKDVKLRMRQGRPEIHIFFDRNRLAIQGLTVADVSNTLHAKMRGLIATRFHSSSDNIMLKSDISRKSRLPTIEEYGSKAFHQDLKELSFAVGGKENIDSGALREVDTIARLEKEFRDTLNDIYNISLKGANNSFVYLQQVADIKAGVGPAEIWRKNKERMVQVSAETGKISLSESAELVDKALFNLDFPKDHYYGFGGDYDKMLRNQRELTQAILLALLLVFMVLASVFESWTQPFIVLCSVPMAMVGVSFALRASNEPISLGVYIGAVILIGIAVNNAIILIDCINRLRGTGAYKELRGEKLSASEAVRDAALWRLRPILMTSLTTILTMTPLMLQKGGTASLWRPLAITVVSGMSAATILTLFIVPSIYLAAEDVGKIFFAKRRQE